MDHDKLLQAAKFQVEYYFGQTNYKNDLHLQKHADRDGWIDLNFVNNFNKMQSFGLPTCEVFEMLKKSIVVDVQLKSRKNKDSIYQIRKRSL